MIQLKMSNSKKYRLNSKINSLNISTVQSIDRKAEHILGRVSQVMHYVFNKSERTWV